MAGNIRGITIELNGDTTKLDKALRDVHNETWTIQNQLRGVERALKMDPGNTDLLAQKERLLGEEIDQTKKKLKMLQQADEQVSKEMQNGVEGAADRHNELQRKIATTKVKEKTLQREFDKLKTVPSKVERISQKMQKLGAKVKTVGAGMQKMGMYASAGAAGSILTGKKLLEMNSTQEQAERKLIEIYKTRMGASEDAAAATMELAAALQQEGVVGDEVALSGAQQLATFAQYPSTVNALLPAMENLLVQQNGYNATAEDATNIANMFGKVLTGQTGALTRVGVTFTEAQEKVLKYGTEEERAAMLAEVITQNVGNMNTEFAKTDEGKMAQLKNTLGDIGERLGHVLLPALADIAGYISESIMPKVEALVQFLEAHPVIAKIAVGITALLAVTGPLLLVLGTVISIIGTAITVMPEIITALGAVKAAIAGMSGVLAAVPWVAAVIAAIAAVVLIVKHWDSIKAFFINLWARVKEIFSAAWQSIKGVVASASQAVKRTAMAAFEGLKKAMSRVWSVIRSIASSVWRDIYRRITSPILLAVGIVKRAIGAISRILSGANFSLPHIKLPHFGITGKFGLNPPEVPHFNVEWYKKAYNNPHLFTTPTVPGFGDGAGGELVYGKSSLMEDIKNAVGDALTGIQMVGSSGRDINIVLEMDRQVFAKAVYKANNDESQRVGVKISGVYA